MQVDTEAPHSCGARERTIDPTQRVGRTKARWYKCTDPSGWYEWGQMCAPCLNTQWRSMRRSWDADLHHDPEWSLKHWKQELFMKVIRRRLRSPPTAGVDEEVRDPEQYELKWPVVPDEPLDALAP